MKKIIALAVASAFVAPVYAADVTLSGDVEYKYKSQDDGAAFDSGDQDIVVKGSEELDNGMVVTASLELDGSEGGVDSDSSLTLDFGAVSVEIGDAPDVAAAVNDEVSGVAESGGLGGAADGNVSVTHTLLVSMSPMPNLGLFVSKSTTDDDADAETLDVDSYAISYSVMGADFAYGIITTEGQDEDLSVMSLGYSIGPVSLAYETIGNVAHVENDDMTNLGVTYSYGSGKIFVETGDLKDDDAGTKQEVTAYGASYKIGNLNTYLELETDKTSASEDNDITTVGVEYKF